MKYIIQILFSLLLVTKSVFAADNIQGFWKTVSEEGVTQSIICVYEYDGLCYGRIIATYGDNGTIDDSIYKPVKRAPGVVGNPFYSGLDIIWDLENGKWVYKGRILDPERGKIYKSELWTEGNNLIVRGKLLMFGRSQTWYPVLKEDLPKDFKLPDPKTFIPVIPQPN
jgi:uncharacterized protein (DUF2147 family)